jgi:type VI secretion system protein ImpH
MASKKRQSNTPLRERFFKEFYSFSFFKAVDLLESLFPDKKPLGQTLSPDEEVVRFSVKPGFTFPPSDISNLTHSDKKKPVNMEVAFMGLIGPSGVLPHWHNELAMERNRQKDFSLTAFYDIFHHRLISLFYLAWKKYRFPVNYHPGAKDRLSGHLLSLTGLGTAGLTEMIGLSKESLIFYSGVPSAVAMKAAVEYFSGADVEVEQFIERLLPLDLEDQTQLGVANGQIGIDAICGSWAREIQTKFRIDLGPMSYDDFIRFMPTGDMLSSIFSLVKYMVGIEYEFDIRLFLKREEVPSCALGMETPACPLLGKSTWIKTPGVIHEEHPYVTFQEDKEPISCQHQI